MNKKAIVSSAITTVHGQKALVFFPEFDNQVSSELPVCSHVGELLPGHLVLVAFCSNDFTDGAIIGKIPEGG